MIDVGSILKSKVAPEVWAALVNHDTIIAGGALTSVFTNKPINDLDIYFRSAESFTQFMADVYAYDIELTTNDDENNELVADYSDKYGDILKVGALTNKSVMMRDKETEQNVQAITYKFFAAPEEIFKDYDFTINKAAYECKTGKLTMHDDFLLHNSQRYLGFSADTTYPIISLLRVRKYEERGYKISKSNMLKIALAITKLDLQSWADVRNHCGGMYGIPLEEIFPDDAEFSIDLAIDKLSGITQIDNTEPYSAPANISLGEFVMKFESILTKSVVELEYIDSTRLFKNVGSSEIVGDEEVWRSIHNSNFLYQLGKIVNGGVQGIYGYRGINVLGGQYWNHSGKGYVLELQPVTDVYSIKNDTYDGSKIQMMGDWKVVGAWKASDFQRRFRKAKPAEPAPVPDYTTIRGIVESRGNRIAQDREYMAQFGTNPPK